MNCANARCNKPIPKPRRGQKFCTGRCRAEWHREHARQALPGEVRSLRALKGGGWSVVVWLPDRSAYLPGARVAIMTENVP